MNGTFVLYVDFSDQEEGPVVQATMEDNLEAEVDDTYESEAKEDYFTNWKLPSPRSHRKS
jgi:hypothetical protein